MEHHLTLETHLSQIHLLGVGNKEIKRRKEMKGRIAASRHFVNFSTLTFAPVPVESAHFSSCIKRRLKRLVTLAKQANSTPSVAADKCVE